MSGRLGKRYARALFSLAGAAGTLEAVAEELGRVVAALEDSRLRPLLLSPVIETRARRATASEVAATLGLSPLVHNLVGLLAQRDRLAIVPDLARRYEELLDEALGRARVAIASATPLGAGERSELTALARRLTGRREILASVEVDPDLLGGVVLDTGGTVYDGSLRTQLVRLRREMAESGG